MSQISILKLPWWADNELGTKDSFLNCVDDFETTPIFNRFGLYRDRINRFCWIESPFGCYNYSAGYDMFCFDLKLLNHKPLTAEQSNALNILFRDKLLDKQLKELYITNCHWKQFKTKMMKGK